MTVVPMKKPVQLTATDALIYLLSVRDDMSMTARTILLTYVQAMMNGESFRPFTLTFCKEKAKMRAITWMRALNP